MKKIQLVVFGLFVLLTLGNFSSGEVFFDYHRGTEARSSSGSPDWGFFAHKRINRLAALTLPPEMMVFFKPNIDWISDHAVDPDKRRYAVSWEGPRHYMDLDMYGQPPFDDLPRSFSQALHQFTEIKGVLQNGDTVLLYSMEGAIACEPDLPWNRYFSEYIFPKFGRDEFTLNADTLNNLLEQGGFGNLNLQSAFFSETLSEHGILPWHLQRMQDRLTYAFRQRNSKLIMRYCADMGHYIGDAHVPLHTTSNYNGQQTGQEGIHGFWESRIPELFADESYDYFVGKPVYLTNTVDFFWNVVFDSHTLVDSVLEIERALRISFPEDRQMCPDMRTGRVIITPCRDFAAAYQEALNGMVERRMRAAIHAVSCAWYTAWVDAGQPDLSNLDAPLVSEEELREETELIQKYNTGKILGRPEGE